MKPTVTISLKEYRRLKRQNLKLRREAKATEFVVKDLNGHLTDAQRQLDKLREAYVDMRRRWYTEEPLTDQDRKHWRSIQAMDRLDRRMKERLPEAFESKLLWGTTDPDELERMADEQEAAASGVSEAGEAGRPGPEPGDEGREEAGDSGPGLDGPPMDTGRHVSKEAAGRIKPRTPRIVGG